MALREARDQGMSTSSGASSALRRIQRELKEIMEQPSQHWTAAPVGDELFEWHFAVRGPPGTDFEGGIYTGRIVLPANYPFAPPSIMMHTPNGRFEVGKKICLSISNYHPELWQPAWGIRTMMEALRSHFPTPGDGAIGALDWPSDVRKRLAKESVDFVCPIKNERNGDLLPQMSAGEIAAEGNAPPPELPASIVEDPFAPTGPAVNVPTETTSVAAATPIPDSPTATETEGLRHRGAPGPTPMQDSTPAPVPAASNNGGGVAAEPVETAETRQARRAAAGQRARQTSILHQLIKPPGNKREWLVFVVDGLICALSCSIAATMYDMAGNPPKF